MYMILVVTELRHDGQQAQQQLTAVEPQQHASCVMNFQKYYTLMSFSSLYVCMVKNVIIFIFCRYTGMYFNYCKSFDPLALMKIWAYRLKALP